MNTLQRKLIAQISDRPVTNKLCTQRQINWHAHGFEKKNSKNRTFANSAMWIGIC